MKAPKGYTACIWNETGGDDAIYYCRECGSEIPEGSDFCYSCGALKKTAIAVDDNGNTVAANKPGTCPYCGFENREGVNFCTCCGKSMAPPASVAVKRTLTTKEKAAIALAVVPGVFSIFGLGHLVMKRYSRAFMYLVISVIWFYMYLSYASASGYMLLLWLMFEFFVYFRQCMEVIGLVYFGNRGGGKSGP